jgi:hypothetical protein
MLLYEFTSAVIFFFSIGVIVFSIHIICKVVNETPFCSVSFRAR